MKSAFGSKRKARKIEVEEEEEEEKTALQAAQGSVEPLFAHTPTTASGKGRKTFRKSGLRQSITLVDDQADNPTSPDPVEETITTIGLPATSNSSIHRSISVSKRNKAPSSKLSFGVGDIINGDAAEELDSELFSRKLPTAKSVTKHSGLRRNIHTHQVPFRGSEDGERPIYNKDYLNELRNSTPSTPKDLGEVVEEIDSLDESELEGATIVESIHNFESKSTTTVPSEAEIREKKERRARLAQEQDFISLNEEGANDRWEVSLLPRKKEVRSRLVRDDEDFAEGFDEFVDDGRISLGKKAEKEAKKRRRKEMAEMINEAEDSASDVSDDSERRAAYEVTQARAGMEGLSKPDPAISLPPKITPLSSLSECLLRFQATLSGVEQDLARHTKKMAELQQEKATIISRKEEVQSLVKEAGVSRAMQACDL